MIAHQPTSWTHLPAAGFLLAACGFSGCTSGPHISSAPQTVSVAGSDRPVAMETTSFAQRGAYPSNSIWGRIDRHERPPVDPFVAADVDRTRDYTSRPVPSAKPIVAVSHAERDVPVIEPNRSTDSVPGVVRIHDGRLPPAAPLGVSNPFGRETQSPASDQTPLVGSLQNASATPSVNSVPVKLAKEAREIRNAGTFPRITPVPTSNDVAKKAGIRETQNGPVQNEDMIVESSLLRRRHEWREEVIPPRAGSEETPFPIAPRRPFSSPEWGEETAATATANLPIDIAQSSSGSLGRESFSVAAIQSLEADVSDLEVIPRDNTFNTESQVASDDLSSSGEETLEDPFQSTESGPIFVVSEPRSVSDSAFSSLAPAPQEEAPEPPRDPEAEAEPIAIASATPEKSTAAWLTPRRSNKVVSPLELDVADRVASKATASQANRSTGTPLAIGLALAAIAVGAVSIRRRFA